MRAAWIVLLLAAVAVLASTAGLGSSPAALTISGIVVDPRGAPQPGVAIYAATPGGAHARTDEQGCFVVSDVPAGRWQVGAWPGPEAAISRVVLSDVRAGTSGLVLVCADRARLVARFTDGRRLRAAWARTREEPWCHRRLEAPGAEFDCASLEPGRYEVVLRDEQDQVAYALDVDLEAGGTTEVALDPLPAARLRVVVDRWVSRVEVRLDDVRVRTLLFADEDPRERVVSLPAGRLTLRAGDLAADGEVFGPPIERWLVAGEQDEVLFEDYSWK